MTTRSQFHESNGLFYRRFGYAALATIAVLVMLLQVDVARAGSRFDLDDYTGKVVLVDFWASWCVPCKRSFPWMNDMHSKYKDDGLVIIAINVDNDLTAANRFLSGYPARFGVHFDEDKSLAREFEVVAMPSSFLVGRDGTIVEQHLGFKVLKQDEYEAAIRAALEVEE